ncbi:hypothetical protein [Allorhizocola rhizosphaerae]|uniref:hypothetical protein n=1 Tax=Allorhizocola rhizosphaerae TaxID=1872709 RepID=UPI000E3D9EA9|nr:hypothetical protein [Allorhizocola rhizosphaerae]
MVPTLSGRIQTRLFLLAVIGWPLTMLVTPLLPLAGPMPDRYRATLVVLAAVAVLGVGWELLYHLLMQWRWEKDWPTLFGLVTLLPEGLLVWLLGSRAMLPGLTAPLDLAAFAIHFVLVWLATWLVANGPMRVVYVRWRFRGGRLL